MNVYENLKKIIGKLFKMNMKVREDGLIEYKNKEDVPKVNSEVVHLDHNVFIRALDDEKFFLLLKCITKEDGDYLFPYTHVHIGEIARIRSEKRVQEHLAIYKEITQSKYLDFHEQMQEFTIRQREPEEVLETMREVPESFIDDISKKASDHYLKDQLPGLPEDCFRPADQYSYLVKLVRSYFPDLGRELATLNYVDALDLVEEKLFGGFSYEEVHKKLIDGFDSDSFLKNMDLSYFKDQMLYSMGYKMAGRELKKPDGLMSDFGHMSFLKPCSIVISDDKRQRERIEAKYKPTEKLALSSTVGICLFLVNLKIVRFKDDDGSLEKNVIQGLLYKSSQEKIAKAIYDNISIDNIVRRKGVKR